MGERHPRRNRPGRAAVIRMNTPQNSDVDKRGLSPLIRLQKIAKYCASSTDTAETEFSRVADYVYKHTGKRWTWKYFHSLYLGSMPFRTRVSNAVTHTYSKMFKPKKPKSPSLTVTTRMKTREDVELVLKNLPNSRRQYWLKYGAEVDKIELP